MNIVPITAEQMERIKAAQEEEERQQQEEIERIQNLDVKSIFEYMRDSMLETDIVLEGLQFTGIKTEISGVTYCAHQKLRGAIQAGLIWLEHNNPDAFPKEDDENDEPASESKEVKAEEAAETKPTKTKKTKKTEVEDDEL